jgi:glycosyltransferase involved in cell wall biosynthesis
MKRNIVKNSSITVIVPAYNEEKYIERAVRDIDNSVKKVFKDYEILLFDDSSIDMTPQIADSIARENLKIKVFHNTRNRGVGYIYRLGVSLASKEYVTILPADGGILSSSVKEVLQHAGSSEIITTYISNKQARSIIRRMVSYGFTSFINILLGYRLRYYNGMVVYKTKLVRDMKIGTKSIAFQAEILLRLLRNGHSYEEVPIRIQEKKGTITSVFRIKNLLGVMKTVLRVFWDLAVLRKY